MTITISAAGGLVLTVPTVVPAIVNVPRTSQLVVPVGSPGGPGPAGPPGPAGADGEGGALEWIVGSGAPLTGSFVEPLDGINDPWHHTVLGTGRWLQAREVSWDVGDAIPAPGVLDLGDGLGTVNFVYVQPGTTLSDWWFGDTALYPSITDGLATEAGTSVAFAMFQAGGATPAEVDAATYVGASIDGHLGDLTVTGDGSGFLDLGATGTGNDGSMYLDADAKVFYGPRTGGGWGDPFPEATGGGPGSPYEYEMPVAQTTILVDHPLGYDPVSVQVLLDGELCSEYSVVYTIPGQQVRVAFDVSVQALIRLM